MNEEIIKKIEERLIKYCQDNGIKGESAMLRLIGVALIGASVVFEAQAEAEKFELDFDKEMYKNC